MSKAQGQFTIIDYNDAITLTGYIQSNQAKTQMYNPDNETYSPDWASTNMILTPSLYVAGSSADIITNTEVQSVEWFEGTGTTAIVASTTYGLGGTKNHILIIKDNVLSASASMDYTCVVTYLDPSTGLQITHKMGITLSKVVNGSGIVDLIVTTPSGNIFKNSEISSLTAKAELWRGSAPDTTNVSYQWYQMDSSVTADQGGGTGWKKLTAIDGKYTGVTTSTLTVYADAVDSYATFECIAKDTDASSATYNSSFVDTASFVDVSDPIQVIITSTGGNVFKNGEGSTVLTAKVYQAGTEIDPDGTGTYTWSKYDSTGTLVSSFSKTGKTLSVGGADVDVKATFMVEVTV